MAAGLALGALGAVIQVVKLFTNPITRQFNYLCCFTSNINSLKDEAKRLDDALAGLEGEVERARDNVQEPVPEVKTWLTNSNNIKVEINGILDEATNVGSGCLKLVARFSLSKKAKKTTDRTKELRGEKNFEVKFQQGPPVARQAVQLGKTYEFESRNNLEEEIMTTLRGGEVNMIGIYGMGGLGKTIMAKKLMNRALKENVFEEVVMAVISQNVDISRVQDEIGGQLGLEKLKDEKSESARVQILHSRLSDRKRTLIVMDDVWERLELLDFGIPLDSEGCTILLTSRNSDILRAMEVQIFGMKVLLEEEAFSFLRDGAGTCVDDRELNPIAKEVAKECGGLPLALAVVGVGLKHQRNAAIWKNALRELKQRVPNTVQFDKEVYNPLKWSYNHLTSKSAQSLFLLCCLFPEDANIPLEYLTYFCMGLGIFEGIRSMEDARNNMWASTEFLKDRSLLLGSDKQDCVRMHDVVRDVCIFIAKEEGYIGKDGCTWISSSHLIGQRNELLSRSRCTNLRLLFLHSGYDKLGFKFDDASVEGMSELNVMCIPNYYSLKTLPHLTQSLGKLRTLILDSCWGLKTISAVGELVNLEILVCRNCSSIEKLPAEMKGLNRLKLLDLTDCRSLKSIGRGIISGLVGLEELKMLGSFKRWEAAEREERENASIEELGALPNLACLEIEIQDPSLVTKNKNLFPSKKIVRFTIRTDFRSNIPSKFSKAISLLDLNINTRLGDWIEKQFLRDTEYLYLSGYGAINVDLAKGQNIRWLQLEDCESMKNLVRTSGGDDDDDATVFPSLEHLELKYLPDLKEICDGPISPTSFQYLNKLELIGLKALTQFWKSNNVPPHFSNLSSIDIRECHSLRNLGQLSMAGKDCLPHLQKLHVSLCSMMEQVFLWNDIEEAIESQPKCHVITKVFPQLKELELFCLRNLTTFYQGIQCIDFPLLREMKITECPKIIIGSSGVDIDEDGSLHLFCQPQKISLGRSFKVLKINHNPFCGHEIPTSLLNGLEELTINKYEGSRMSLFTLSVAANLVSLRVLRISNCNEMINVMEEEEQQLQKIPLFPTLKILELEKLPKLVSFCDSKCKVELHLLKKLVIERCPNFSMGLVMVATPNLEAFTTDLTSYVGIGLDVAFNSLKELMISKNENPLYHQKISVSLFNGLEKLEFFRCKMSLFSSSAVANLVNLKVLNITDCDEIVQVIEDEEEDGKVVVSGGEIITSVVIFPKLEELTLRSLRKLVRFCKWKCDVQLPSLKEVVIKYCPNMETFSMGLVATPKLKILEIEYEKTGATKDLNGALHQRYLARREKEYRVEEERIQREEKKKIRWRETEEVRFSY